MIEILVALVILAIGLLGMATLMINSMQTNQSAALRSAATLAAYDMVERMRSNTDEEVLKQGSYATPLKKVSELYPSNTICDDCIGTALAENDIKNWAYALNEVVPGAWVVIKSTGTVKVITKDNVEQDQHRLWCIGIFWEDTGGKEVTSDSASACGESAKIDNKPWAFYQVEVLL